MGSNPASPTPHSKNGRPKRLPFSRVSRAEFSHAAWENCVLVIGEPWRTSLRSCAPSRLDSPARDLAPRRFAPSRQILRSRASLVRPVAVSMNPAFSSSASRGELRFARAPRRASTRPRSLRSPQNAPRCASTRPRSLRALQNAPRRASTRPPLTSCATECAPSHLDSPAALVRSSRLNGCALRL